MTSIECPECRGTIRFYHFGSMGELAPHFYCSRCSNLYFRASDATRIREEPHTVDLLHRIALTLPSCPCGGQFLPGQDPKCPRCGTAIPNRLDPVQRLSDAHAVLIEGADLFTHE